MAKKLANRPNNKGLTLVELMISFAILGIISAGLVVLMTNTSRTYRSVYNLVDLQYEYQVVMTQMREQVIGCNAGIAFDGERLYVVNYTSSGLETTTFFFDAAEATLYLEDGTTDPPVVSKVITWFSVGQDGNAFLIDTVFEHDGRGYSGTQRITARNVGGDGKPILFEGAYAELMTKLTAIYP